jgi:hypothetical protein
VRHEEQKGLADFVDNRSAPFAVRLSLHHTIFSLRCSLLFCVVLCKLLRYIAVLLCCYYRPDVVVKWSTLLLNIREVPGSNLGPETGYTEVCFIVFLSPPMRIPGQYVKNHAASASFHILSNSSFTDHRHLTQKCLNY